MAWPGHYGEVVETVVGACEAMLEADVGANKAIGSYGKEALLAACGKQAGEKISVLTHCNTVRRCKLTDRHQLDPVLKALVFQLLESTSLSKPLVPNINLHAPAPPTPRRRRERRRR